ncbi:MAG: hypothetical protein P8J32_01470 [bacterium]|nr:hypothetical protein [bacterium]
MGACTFGQTEIGKFKNVGEAYRAAQEEANHEEGHNPYNGTISTCTSLSVARNAPRFGTQAFDKFEDKLLDDLGKRECLYVELTGAALQKRKPNYLKGKKGVKGYYFFGWAAE